jgi:hypothetical protein
MFGKPLEDFIGEVRKFQMDMVTWEYTIIAVENNHAIVQMICYGQDSQLAPVTLVWDRGELGQHGFN